MAEKKKSALWKKLRPKLSTILVLAPVIFLIIWLFGKNFYTIFQLSQQKRDIQLKIMAEEEKSQQLDEDLKQIGTKNYIEMLARKYLNLYYPDEKVVVPVEGDPPGKPDQKQKAFDSSDSSSDEEQSEENHE